MTLGRFLIAVVILGGIAWTAPASGAWIEAIIFGAGTLLLVLWYFVTLGGRRS